MIRLLFCIVFIAGLLLVLTSCSGGGGAAGPSSPEAPSQVSTKAPATAVAQAEAKPTPQAATSSTDGQAKAAAPSCETVFDVLEKQRELQSLSPLQLLGLEDPAAVASQTQAAVDQGDFQEACRVLDQALAQASSGDSNRQPAASTAAGAPSGAAGPLPVTQVTSQRSPVLDYAVRQPPIASLITIGAPGPDGATEVTGAAGSVPARADVLVSTANFADPIFVLSDPDGSFDATVTAAPGATVQVRYNPYPSLALLGQPLNDIHQRNHWPGTLIRVPDSSVAGVGTLFSSAGFSDVEGGFAFWSVEGLVSDVAVQAGEAVTVSGSMSLLGNGTDPLPGSVDTQLIFGLDALFDSEGRQTTASSNYVSSLMTPTGLPIERERGPMESNIKEVQSTFRKEGDALTVSFGASLPIPGGLPDGMYRLYVWVPGEPDMNALATALEQGPEDNLGQRGSATVGLVTVGSPKAPQLSAALLVDSPNQGGRGVVSEDEKSRYGLAARVATQPDAYVVEPTDPGTGKLISYRLEPFFPFVSMADRNFPNPPHVPFKLPGGSLTVSVVTPSGQTENLGTAPILQSRTGLASTSQGQPLDSGGGNMGDVYQLTTLSDDFIYQFDEYGQYTINLSGEAEDIWGRTYPFSGAYKVWAAESLDIEAASLPSIPFEVGDRLPVAARVYPGVPADIEMSMELYPIDGSAKTADSASGRADRFGYFDGGGKAFEFGQAGEYVVRLTAKYQDDDGRLWMASRRWGSGVADTAPTLIAHGNRGEDSGLVEEHLAWFSRSAIGVEPGPYHINFPYNSGDIVWATDEDSVQTRVTLQDPVGQVASLLAERADQSSFDAPSFQERSTAGELPLGISTSSGLEATSDPGSIDQWGYAYRTVERPGVRVREMVATDFTKSPYWRFNEEYLAQRGMGAEGDLPNDMKWQFGATVFKRPDQGIGEVAIYGSLWVGIADNDPLGSRVFPPFQGASGGPDGGPIITLKGQEIDLFLLPTGVQPGAVLEQGDRFVFAGQVGPPLASEVTATVNSPSGVTRTISGKANSVGYFSDSSAGFQLDEPGVWTVETGTVFKGTTSAGPVEAPYPTGGVLGAATGGYEFYVVPSDSQRVDAGLSGLSFASNPGHRAIGFYPHVPDGWTNVQAHYSITMPGYILEQGLADAGSGVVEVVYDPVKLQRDFPNIDLKARADQRPGLSDQVTVSLLLTGEDSSGQAAYAAKQLTLVGEDIYDQN